MSRLLFLQACSDDKKEESGGKANGSARSAPVTGNAQFQNSNIPGNMSNYRPMPANTYPGNSNSWSQQMPSTNNSAEQYPNSGYSQNQGSIANQYRPLESTATTTVHPAQNAGRMYAPVVQPYYAPGHQYGTPNYVPPVPAYGSPGSYPGYVPQGGYGYPNASIPPTGGYVAPGAW